MTMNFRTVKAALVTLLTANAGGAFRVEGSQPQAAAAAEFVGVKRSVRVFYSSGNFPKSGGSMRGPVDHDLSFGLQLTVVQPATVDLDVLNDPSSSAAQRVTALAAVDRAADLADDSYDELTELVFQIIMDAQIQSLGLADYTVGSRWVENTKKNNVEPLGEYVVLTGAISFTCSVEEQVTGATPVTGVKNEGEIEIKEDTVQKTGIETDIS